MGPYPPSRLHRGEGNLPSQSIPAGTRAPHRTSGQTAIAREAGLKRILVPVPFAAWQALAWIAEMMPSPPITRNQVALMQVDHVPSSEMPGFGQLGISTHTVEETLQEILRMHPP